jgi:diazepam-binding inhibitor (GABA receptor modulating acyl-CoA-binding protein)
MSDDSLKEQFEQAVQLASSEEGGTWPLTQDEKLMMYACFKQVNVGPCQGERPGMFQLTARKKYDAWKGVENMSPEDAMKKYIEIVNTHKK